MRYILGPILGVAVVLTSSQVHPCDAVAPTNVTVVSGAPLKVQFCARPIDAPEAFTVYTDGTPSDLRPMTMTTPPNSFGDALYEGPRELQFAKGSYVIQITLWNTPFPGAASQEGAKSLPLSLTANVSLPLAGAPRIVGLTR